MSGTCCCLNPDTVDHFHEAKAFWEYFRRCLNSIFAISLTTSGSIQKVSVWHVHVHRSRFTLSILVYVLTSAAGILFRFKQAQLYLHYHSGSPVTPLHLMLQVPTAAKPHHSRRKFMSFTEITLFWGSFLGIARRKIMIVDLRSESIRLVWAWYRRIRYHQSKYETQNQTWSHRVIFPFTGENPVVMSTDVQLVAMKASSPVIGTKINYHPLNCDSYS
jgi:hypothetical protein